jgi:hypothetical protein
MGDGGGKGSLYVVGPCHYKLDNALLSSLASHPAHTHTSTPSHRLTQILYGDQLATCHISKFARRPEAEVCDRVGVPTQRLRCILRLVTHYRQPVLLETARVEIVLIGRKDKCDIARSGVQLALEPAL